MVMPSRRGFTLLDLLVSIALMSVLATLAVPRFLTLRLAAQRAEVPANVASIRVSEIAYDAAQDSFVRADPHGGRLDREAVPWGDATGFHALGWRPEGDVRGEYEVQLDGNDFRVVGRCDVDDDDVIAEWSATKDQAAVQNTAADVY